MIFLSFSFVLAWGWEWRWRLRARQDAAAAGTVSRFGFALEGVVLEGVVLEGIVLEGIVLEGTVLEGTVLEGTCCVILIVCVSCLCGVVSRGHVWVSWVVPAVGVSFSRSVSAVVNN